ncbi:MAG: DAK2 domain-containing protein [Adlercreutzia sp.]
MSTTTYSSNNVLNAVAAAAKVLDERKEEVNRLNVFPVPDGDTGTNMSLTIQSVVSNVANLPIGASGADIRKAVTTGALMGARGNSGVITSQILRGLCEGSQGFDEFDVESIAGAFDRAREVAFQAVRKPVEGTILTVLRDSAAAAKNAAEQELPLPDALDAIVAEAYASVQRTPDLLPVLKEHGVVDAGGFGLAIIFDAFTAALLGRSGTMVDEMSFARGAHPKVEIEQVNDWEGSQYRYCNEFLVDSDTLDKDAALEFLSTMGDCELCVGEVPKFKVHVHSDHPDQVLKYFLDHGQISEVFIHNMQIQSAERNEKLAAEEQAERKPLGFVAVAAGSGQAEILKSLGVDVIVSGGQTMNPSTKDLLDAAGSVNADAVIICRTTRTSSWRPTPLPSCRDALCRRAHQIGAPGLLGPVRRGWTPLWRRTSREMTEAAQAVKTGEVTWATRDSKDAEGNPIAEGDVIGIADGSIEAVDDSIDGAVLTLLGKMEAENADTCTILAGEGYSDEDLEALVVKIEEAYDELEVDAQRGEQPLYPIVFSVE